jgi:hypothetical protein
MFVTGQPDRRSIEKTVAEEIHRLLPLSSLQARHFGKIHGFAQTANGGFVQMLVYKMFFIGMLNEKREEGLAALSFMKANIISVTGFRLFKRGIIDHVRLGRA